MTVDRVRAFYMGDAYPAIICFIVAFAGISGLEIYIGILHTLLAAAGLLISRSMKPVLVSLLTFVMQLSVKNSPFYPSFSDYLYTGWRLYAIVGISALIIAAFTVFIVKNRVHKRILEKNTPPLFYFVPLFLSLIINGAFSGKWVAGDFALGFANAFVLCILPLIIYHGLSEEDSDGIAGYFSYLCVLIGLVILSELAALFITNKDIFAGGAINKTEVALGFGIWNLIGNSLVVLIPVIFYGIQKNRHPVLYFLAASAVYIGAVFTMSRNALLLGSAMYISCILISCFFGKYNRQFRILSLAAVISVLTLFIIFFDQITNIFRDYFNRGFSDNGRFTVWKYAFENFLKAPLFGKGFYGFVLDDTVLYPFGPLAKQAHNTYLQLLSATGIFGFFSYAYYRYFSIREIFCKISLKKAFMALSMGALLLGSLLDNFIFNIYPTFSYAVSFVIIMKENEEKASETPKIIGKISKK